MGWTRIDDDPGRRGLRPIPLRHRRGRRARAPASPLTRYHVYFVTTTAPFWNVQKSYLLCISTRLLRICC